MGYTAAAFAREYSDDVGSFPATGLARLQHGADDVNRLRSAAREIAGPDAELLVSGAEDEYGASVSRALDVLTTALLVVALVAGAAGALAVGQAITRQTWTSSSTADVLTELGAPRAHTVAALAMPSILAVVGAAAIAVIVAIAAAPLLPIGVARRAAPDPGVLVDVPVLAFGGALLIVLASLWAVVSTWRLTRSSVTRAVPRRTATVAKAAARMGAGPVSTTGLRFAYDPGRGRSSVPVRSAILGVVVGLAGLVGAGTIAASLHDLVGSPDRYGWTWSVVPDVSNSDPARLDAVAADPGLDGASVVHSVGLELDDVETRGFAFEPLKGDIGASVRAGRAPATPTEVALGARTMAALGTSIGETVSGVTAGGSGQIDLDVVGEVVLPNNDNPEPGEGALLTPAGLARVGRSDGFDSLVLRYAKGADADAVERRLADRFDLGFSEYSLPRVPGSLQNLDDATSIISALALFFVVLGVVGLAHALVVSVRRRRHDLAILRSMGLRKREVGRTVRWQAAATAATGLVIGVPLGLVGGRVVWRIMVEDLGLLDAPSQPWLLIAVVAPLTIGLALVIAWLPSRAAVRVRAAAALRAE
jgi:hypothetical protein